MSRALLIALAALSGCHGLLRAQVPEGWFQKWLDEDVRYIATDGEKQAFNRLKTDEERFAFVDHFWRQRVPTNSIGTGQFVIRSSKVRPRINDVFKQSETLGIYTEFYNFGIDSTTRKLSGSVEYRIVNNADKKKAIDYTEDLADPKAFPNASRFLVLVMKKYPLKSLPSGTYTLRITVNDKVKNQILNTSRQFTVTPL